MSVRTTHSPVALWVSNAEGKQVTRDLHTKGPNINCSKPQALQQWMVSEPFMDFGSGGRRLEQAFLIPFLGHSGEQMFFYFASLGDDSYVYIPVRDLAFTKHFTVQFF